jgi:hypothetical protein
LLVEAGVSFMMMSVLHVLDMHRNDDSYLQEY